MARTPSHRTHAQARASKAQRNLRLLAGAALLIGAWIVSPSAHAQADVSIGAGQGLRVSRAQIDMFGPRFAATGATVAQRQTRYALAPQRNTAIIAAEEGSPSPGQPLLTARVGR